MFSLTTTRLKRNPPSIRYAVVAQLAEQRTFNPLVGGSIPSGRTDVRERDRERVAPAYE